VITVAWNEKSKNKSKWLKKRGSVKVPRGAFSKYNTRGEIAEEIHGDAGARVNRRDMEDRFGIKKENKFSGTGKGSSDWSKIE